jgi:hypothetical protein
MSTDIQNNDTHSTKQKEEELVAVCKCHMKAGVLYSTRTLPKIVCKAIGESLPPKGFKPFLEKHPELFTIRTCRTDATPMSFTIISGRRPHDLGAAALGTAGQGSLEQQWTVQPHADQHDQQQKQKTQMCPRDEGTQALLDHHIRKAEEFTRKLAHHNRIIASFGEQA